MPHSQSKQFAQLLTDARVQQGFSVRGLAAHSGVAASNIMRLERGDIAQPTQDTLDALAGALGIDAARLYEAAGYHRPTTLPTFTPYLRSKYRNLPARARSELETEFSRIATKYGYDPAGPAPGEDETD